MSEKRVYAVAESVPNARLRYLTPGKRYEVQSETDSIFTFVDNEGREFRAAVEREVVAMIEWRYDTESWGDGVACNIRDDIVSGQHRSPE